MLVGSALVIFALVCSSKAMYRVSVDNASSRLPWWYGEFDVPKTRQVRTGERLGWIFSLIGGVLSADTLWPERPLLAAGVLLAAVILVNAVPGLIITALHNHRHPTVT
ncbi:hypothetical protein ABH922_001513 [Rhodococcus sp. 27YEA15]|uniref:hypothetical protein n=1 Tax=Rhodococcus sp. 27YEA15 TaxID=3156259 RepID=UPI003C7B65E5